MPLAGGLCKYFYLGPWRMVNNQVLDPLVETLQGGTFLQLNIGKEFVVGPGICIKSIEVRYRHQTIELEFCVDLQLYHNIAGVAVTIVARNRFRWWRCYWGDDLARVVSRNLALLDLGV